MQQFRRSLEWRVDMALVLRKGTATSYTYTVPDYPTLTVDWTGNVSMYDAYPGTAVLTVPMTRTSTHMAVSITAANTNGLTAGVYAFVSTITNAYLGIEVSVLEYATLLDVAVFDAPMTRLYMTIGKLDGTAAGKQTSKMSNTVNGVVITLGWAGLPVTASNLIADELSGKIISTEAASTVTNAAGYAEMYVIKGISVLVTCPGFGKVITVNTAGLDSVDLSTYFIPPVVP
jgi:hypothetical protein